MSQITNIPAIVESNDSTTNTGELGMETDATFVPAKTRIPQWISGLVQSLPTILVLAMLVGIGFWGHHNSWGMPKFSEVVGDGKTAKDDWCEEHGVPDSICIACHAELMPKKKLNGWCKEHGIHECPFHHPDVAQLAKIPKIEKRDLERASRALKLKKRRKNNPDCKLYLRRIQFASEADVDKTGIDISLAGRKKIIETFPASGAITYDQTRVARLSTRTAGTVWRVYRNVGDTVRKSDILAVINASEVGRQKAELLVSIADFDLRKIQRDQLKDVAGGGVAARVFQEAQAAFSAAEIRVRKSVQNLVNLGFSLTTAEVLKEDRGKLVRNLHFLGLPDDIARYLDPEKTTSNLIPVRAPADGEVVTRDVVAGEVVDTRKVLFTVVDTSRMWLMLNVAMENAPLVKIGRKVLFRPDGSEEEITGEISWISTKADSMTRTVKVRVELPNKNGSLRDETFGAGKIVLREEPEAIVVPNDAVHWDGCCYVVFVRDKNYKKKGSYKVFHTRQVRVGVRTATHTEIIAGVLPREFVVTKGGGVLRAELLKGNLGPGCLCE